MMGHMPLFYNTRNDSESAEKAGKYFENPNIISINGVSNFKKNNFKNEEE